MGSPLRHGQPGPIPAPGTNGFNVVKDPSGNAEGPVSLRDQRGKTVPVLTDVAGTVYYNYAGLSGHIDDPNYPLTDDNLGWPGGYYHIDPSGHLAAINEAFADGHVAQVQAHALVLRYIEGPFDDWR